MSVYLVRFRGVLLNVADFNPPHLHLSPQYRGWVRISPWS